MCLQRTSYMPRSGACLKTRVNRVKYRWQVSCSLADFVNFGSGPFVSLYVAKFNNTIVCGPLPERHYPWDIYSHGVVVLRINAKPK